jgi:hypothetical protein
MEGGNSGSSDDLISSFIDMTGANRDEANTLLESTNYNLEQAVTLYWDCQRPNPSSEAM